MLDVDVAVPEIEPVVVEGGAPTLGVERVGAGVVTSGLRPLVPVSVAPSGMPPPTSVAFVLPAWGEVERADEACDDMQPVALPAVSPPPSKVPLDPVTEPQLPGIGLSPPGLISVAPSGMPVPLVPPDAPGTPRGDVVPIPDGEGRLWASAAAQINKKAAVTANARNIGISISVPKHMRCAAGSD